MKKLSRLTALILALVLTLSTGLSAVAESIVTKEQYFAAARAALQRMIMGTATYQEYKAITTLIETDTLNEFYASLEDEEFQDMLDHVVENYWDACVSYTNVGPFLPAVDYSVYLPSSISTYGLGEMGIMEEEENGLILNKTATANSDGTYQIQLEAFVTGNVTAEDVYLPCDIALVLDFSSSMLNEIDDGLNKMRIKHLQEAVNEFIDVTASKYSEKADHRISLTIFDSEADTKNEWTFVTGKNNIDNLKLTDEEIEEEDNGGWLGSGTNPGAGMTLAASLLADKANYPNTGEHTNTTRKKIVILFTDGEPNSRRHAVTAIEQAYALKQAGATVYSIAIHEDANPGAQITNWTNLSSPYINQLLHAVSSNYKNARANYDGNLDITPGTKSSDSLQYYQSVGSDTSLSAIFNKIAENIDGEASMELGSTTVVKDIVTPQFVLPANTTDFTITTAQFTGTTVAEYTDSTKWAVDTGSNDISSSITATPDTANNTLNVNGFDFAKHFVSKDGRSIDNPDAAGTYKGRKLIITFNVTRDPGFLGGLDVYTNTSAGVYTPDNKAVEYYEWPQVDVLPVKTITPVIQDQYIYQSNRADLKALLGKYSQNSAYLSYTIDGEEYPVDGDNNAYVEIVYEFYQGEKLVAKYTIPKGTAALNADKTEVEVVGNTTGTFVYYDESGNVITDGPILNSDTEYTIKCTVDAGTDENNVSHKTQSESTAYVFVYNPVLTYVDESEVYLSDVGMTADEYYATQNFIDEVTYWQGNYRVANGAVQSGGIVMTGSDEVQASVKNSDGTVVTTTVANMNGDEPDLAITYTTDDEFLTDTQVTGQSDVNVNIANVVGSNGQNITEYTSAIRKKCAYKCGHSDETVEPVSGEDGKDPEFVIHITDVYGKLAIIKIVEDGRTPSTTNPVVPDATFIFNVVLKDENGDPLNNKPYTITATDDENGTVISSDTVSDGGQIQLKAGQTATIEQLPPSSTCHVSEVVEPGFISTPAYVQRTITAGQTSEALFNNTYKPEPLTITKKIVDANGNVINDVNVNDDVFGFRVTLPAGTYVMSDQNNNKSELIFDSQNTYQNVYITGAGSVTIADIPVHEDYTVEELALPTGYSYDSIIENPVYGSAVKVESADKLSIKSNISAGGSRVTFVNEYTTKQLTINKVVTNNDGNTGDDLFSVAVTLPKGKYYVNDDDVLTDFGSAGTADPVTVELTDKLSVDAPITIKGIPQGAAYNVVELTDSDHLPVGYLANGVSYEGCSGNLDADSEATITNTYQTGELVITKTVDNEINFIPNDVFTFTVTLPDGEFNYTIYKGETREAGKIKNGGTIKLQDGWSVAIHRIPAGADYRVVETAKTAYVTTSTGNADEIVANSTKTAAFTNTHKVGNLMVSKMVDLTTVDSGDRFVFTVVVRYNKSGLTGTYTATRTYTDNTTASESIVFTSGNAELYVGNGEKVEIAGLPAGATYVVEEILEEPTDYVNTEKTGDSGTIPVYGTGTAHAHFTNIRKNSDLIITKTVKDANGGNNLIPAEQNKEFSFNIILSAPQYVTLDTSYVYTKTGENAEQTLTLNPLLDVNGDKILDENGKPYMFGAITLKHGQSASFATLPVGTKYEIVEVEDSDYITSPAGGYEGTTVVDDTTTEEIESTPVAEFTNTHRFGYLKISKTIVNNSGYALPDYVDQDFDVKVYLPEGTYKYSINNGVEKSLTVSKGSTYGIINLVDGDTAIIKVPPETVYNVEENVPAGYVDTYEFSDTGDKKVIEATLTDEVKVTNTYTPASLQIVKNIVDSEGNVIADGETLNKATDGNVENDSFTFQVTMPNLPQGSYPVVIGGTVRSTSLQGGYFISTGKLNTVYTFEIVGAGNITINAIPVSDESYYTVTESGYPAIGYDGCTITGGAASVIDGVASGILDEAHQVVAVEFNNKYVTTMLELEKLIDGKDSNTVDDVFYINVSGIPAGTYPVTGNTNTKSFDGDGEISIIGDGKVTISNIPVGSSYSIVENVSKLPTGYVTDAASIVYTEPNGTIEAAGKKATIKNIYKTGNLEITKTVENDFVGDEFVFTVSLKGKDGNALEGSFPSYIDDVKQNTTVSDGSTIVLIDGQKASIKNLPDGTAYTVVETPDSDYYDPFKSGDTGTIEADETKTAAFTNTHKNGGLTVSKSVDNVNSTEAFEFEVYVEFEDAPLKDGTYSGVEFEDGKATIRVSANNSKTIEGLPAGASFTVTEKPHDSYTTDPVSREVDGTIPDGSNASAAFTNTHKLGTLEVSKEVQAVSGYSLTSEQTGMKFEFTVTLVPPANVKLADEYAIVRIPADSSDPNPTQTLTPVAGSTVNAKSFIISLAHNESFKLIGLPIGTTYTVSENDNEAYSTTVVRNDASEAVGEPENGMTGTIDANGEKLEYINSHIPGVLVVEKRVIVPLVDAADTAGNGNADLLDKTFYFTIILNDKDGNRETHSFDYEVKSNSDPDTVVMSGTIQNGYAQITLMDDQYVSIVGLLPGTQYEVTEAPAVGYITTFGDGNADDNKGEIEAATTDVVTCINTYNPGALKITKVIKNPDANTSSDEFKFRVSLPGGSYAYTDQNNKSVKFAIQAEPGQLGTYDVTIVGANSVVISGIPVGWEYAVQELESSMPNGYTLESIEDKTNAHASVNKVEQSIASYVALDEGTEVVFTNNYTTVELEITKEVIGDLAPKTTEEFEFEVKFYTDDTKATLQDGTFAYTVKSADNTIAEEGNVSGSNAISIKLKHGQTVTYTGIPAETYYTVEEELTADQQGYYRLTSSTGDTGSIVAGSAKAKFVNTYQYGSLTITKAFSKGVEPEAGETFVFKVMDEADNTWEIITEGEESITLSPLPIGKYKVIEDTSWSWRYLPVDGTERNVEVLPENNTPVVFTNNRVTDQWLDDNAIADNVFRSSGNK